MDAGIQFDVTTRYDRTKNGTHNLNIYENKVVKIPDCTKMYFFQGQNDSKVPPDRVSTVEPSMHSDMILPIPSMLWSHYTRFTALRSTL